MLHAQVVVVNLAEPIAAQLLPRLDAIIQQAAERTAAQARTAIQSPPKTGRIYRRHGRIHQASAPNEAPATDTGFLVNSIATRRGGRLSWEVLAAASYAAYLEMGTMRMAPRPFLMPALLAQAKWLSARIGEVLGD